METNIPGAKLVLVRSCENAAGMLREAEVVSNRRNKPHQTMHKYYFGPSTLPSPVTYARQEMNIGVVLKERPEQRARAQHSGRHGHRHRPAGILLPGIDDRTTATVGRGNF